MTLVSRPLSSVTRWLLVVVGCAVLETAQPTKAASAEVAPSVDEATSVAAPEVTPPSVTNPAPAAAPGRSTRTGDTLLIPAAASRPSLDGPRSTGTSSWLVVLALCAGGAAWYWWRRRGLGPMGGSARSRQIEIEESRPLGNRQYLVVAAVGERKFLLGITPGSIQMLAPLEAKEEPAHASVT